MIDVKVLGKLMLFDPDIMSNARLRTLFDYLEAGDDLQEFLEDFPSVPRDHAMQVLQAAKDSLLVQAGETCA